ncbi:MAG: C25 family cysteine peptidase [Methanothrix sp.]|nr:C25 family cysteine peptidase [Methanothrix sp.]MDD4448149.1 C25 family cysteine peptidase [Methanothrix sp.]
MGKVDQENGDLYDLGLLPNSADSVSNLPLADAKSSVTEITVLLNAGNYSITKDKDGYDVIKMDGFPTKYLTGKPLLPRGISKVLLPPNVDYSTLRLEVVSEEKQILDGTYNIRPASEDLPQSENSGAINVTSQNETIIDDVYRTDAAYPDSYVNLLPPSQMRKWVFVPVEFIPFQYNPVQGTLTLINSVKVKISYELNEMSSADESSLLKDTVFDSLAPEMFINYEEMGGLYLDQRVASFAPSATGRYVIITTNAIRSGSTKLNSFIDHKQSLGYTVSVVTETDFGGLTGQYPNNRAEKIREWLKNNYVSLGIKYVLLIGNPSPYESGEGDIPMKMCWPRYGAGDRNENAPTDAFYADLTGNWDSDGDGYYGEWSDFTASGGVDFSPEVYVGRIPVYGADYVTLDNILQKTINYEISGSTAWRKNALLPMSFCDVDTDGAYLGEQMKNNYLSPNSYSSWRMYQHVFSGYCTLDSVFSSEENLRGGSVMPNRWAGNDFGIVGWWGGGDNQDAYVYDYCSWGVFMGSGNALSLDDTHPSFTYQCSSWNGRPEDAYNLQYAILKNGGIATVSATRGSWYYRGQTDFVMTTSNAGIGYEYVKRLVQETAAADALMQVKSSMTPGNQARLMNFFVINVYGDPSVSIKNPSIPSTWTSLGGYLTSKQSAITDSQGRRHVFVRGADNALWDNVDGSWVYIGGTLTSAPYAAKDKNGRIHIVVRGADYALWDYVFDTASWTGSWKGLGGYLGSMATASMEPTYGVWMKIVVRGGDNSLWLCEFNVDDLSTYNWIGFGGYLNSWPFVIFDQDSRMHVFVAGGDNALWDNRGILSSGVYYHNWHSLGGIMQDAPFSTLELGYNGYLLAMVRGSDNALWIADIYAKSDPETCNWIGFGGVLASEPFASTDTSGRVHTFVRGSDGAMWENVFSSNPWNPSGAQWIGYGGSINIWSPQALMDGQTYAYVQGLDNAMWRKVFITSVASSAVGEASGKVDSLVEAVTLVEGATGSSKV